MHEEIKKMLDHVTEYATELLHETGDCYPFGAFIDRAGNVHPLEMEIDKNNIPQLHKVVDALNTYCKTEFENKNIAGYCISYEVRVTLNEHETTDAVAFDITHVSEQNLPQYYLPFKIIPKDQWSDDPDFKRAEVREIFAVRRN